MPRSLHVVRFFVISLGLHSAFFAALYFFEGPVGGASKETTPIRIVDLPPQVTKRLPPVRPFIPRGSSSESYGGVPELKQAGKRNEVKLPKTASSRAEDNGIGTGGIAPVKPGHAPGAGTKTGDGKSPLPFLSQADIDDLAQKGMSGQKLQRLRETGDILGLITEEFKRDSYDTWFLAKINKELRYPKLAEVSGLQGVALTRIEILKNGSVSKIEIMKSTGYKILDDEVIRHIRESAPFQPLPEDWHTDRYNFDLITIFWQGIIYFR